MLKLCDNERKAKARAKHRQHDSMLANLTDRPWTSDGSPPEFAHTLDLVSKRPFLCIGQHAGVSDLAHKRVTPKCQTGEEDLRYP